MMEQDRKEWLVITADREIMDHAWSYGSVPVPSDQFLRLLEQADNDLKDDDEFLEEDDSAQQLKGTHPCTPPGRGIKGSSRQLSKKDKALTRVLKKL